MSAIAGVTATGLAELQHQLVRFAPYQGIERGRGMGIFAATQHTTVTLEDRAGTRTLGVGADTTGTFEEAGSATVAGAAAAIARGSLMHRRRIMRESAANGSPPRFYA